MLRFEAALARVETRSGIIPGMAADAIAGVSIDAFDPAAIARGARASGTIAIGFVEALRARVRTASPEAATFVHWGATSQDVTDTALVAACGVYAATLGRIAGDVSLLMQFEIAEASEPGGRSSSMPHKRNPAGSAIALAAATRAPGLVAAFLAGMTQEHERGVGGWHAEATTVASVVQTTGAALAAGPDLVATLRVDPECTRRRPDCTGGFGLAVPALR